MVYVHPHVYPPMESPLISIVRENRSNGVMRNANKTFASKSAANVIACSRSRARRGLHSSDRLTSRAHKINKAIAKHHLNRMLTSLPLRSRWHIFKSQVIANKLQNAKYARLSLDADE